MTLYNAGDKVLVRNDLEEDNTYKMIGSGEQDSVVREMLELSGRIVTIDYAYGTCYRIKEQLDWNWTDEMFVGKVVQQETYNFGDKIVIRDNLYENEMHNGVNVTEEMLEYCGKIATIVLKDYEGDFLLNVDSEDYYWASGMFAGKLIECEELEKVEEESETVEETVETMKFKVGDKVRIREDLKSGGYYKREMEQKDLLFNSSMHIYLGKVATIAWLDKITGNYGLDVDGEGIGWSWSIGMLEEIKPRIEETIKVDETIGFGIHIERVIYNEPATIMFYNIPETDELGNVVSYGKTKKSIAKCNPTDEYDKDKGFTVCILRAVRKEADKHLSKI